VDVESSFPPGGQSAKLVQQGDGLFDDPAAGVVAVAGLAAADQRHDPAGADLVAVDIVVIAPVGQENIGSPAWSSAASAYRRDRVDQRDQLSDVVAVGAGHDRRERRACSVADQVVFGADLGPVDRARAGSFAPFFARMWEESTHARDQSIWAAAFSSANNRWCSWSKTPACCQSRKRRQQVIPEPNPSSWGRSSQPIPVHNTNKMPCNTNRSGNGLGPVRLAGRTGSNGSIRLHNPSETTHARTIKIIPDQDHQSVRSSKGPPLRAARHGASARTPDSVSRGRTDLSGVSFWPLRGSPTVLLSQRCINAHRWCRSVNDEVQTFQ
jgi:hypothetical protein